MDMLSSPDFWIAVGQIIMIDILLGGDNAVVIALACRKLPPAQRTQGILWGTAGAIVLRIILIFFALKLLAIPLLKIIGAVLLVWIGVKLLLPEHDDEHGNIEGSDKLWGAVKTVIVADFVMSVDNVIAIAGAAESSGTGHGMALVIFGVLVSIPIIVWGSQLVIKLMDRFPIIITGGGMLLGWIAGSMAITDPALVNPDTLPQFPKLGEVSDPIRYAAGAAGALLVLAMGKWLGRRQHTEPAASAARSAPPATATPAGKLQRVLLAVDGSDPSQRAVKHLLALRAELRTPESMDVLLLNVQPPVPGNAASYVSKDDLQDYHREQADKAMADARLQLKEAGLTWRDLQQVGTPGQTIAEVAEAERCSLIVMGTRGQGSATAALLGSVAQGVIAATGIPILLVK